MIDTCIRPALEISQPSSCVAAPHGRSRGSRPRTLAARGPPDRGDGVDRSAPDNTFRKWRWPVIVPSQRGRWRDTARRQRVERTSARDEASEPFMAEETSRHQRFTGETRRAKHSSGWEREAGWCSGGGGGHIQ